MDCKDLRKIISEYIDGKLVGGELSRFEEHILKCRECSKILEETRSAVKFVSGVRREELPAGYFQRLNRRLDEELGEEKLTKPVFLQ